MDGDTVLVRPGTYQEAVSWANKDLTLLGDALPPAVIITTGSMSTVMSVGPGVSRQTRIENLTIRDGRAEAGGGIALLASAPIIQGCRFEGNVAVVSPDAPLPSRGGGLFVSSGSTPMVADCSFTQNLSLGTEPIIQWPGDGGAIYVQPGGSLEVRRCHFEDNEASGGFEGGRGGAIHLNGQATAIIDSCTFDRNFGFGGGIWSMWQVSVNNCIFRGQLGWSGAAFYAINGTCEVQNSQFFDNIVGGDEGGTIVAAGGGRIANNTIAFNQGWNGVAGLSADEAIVTNNIICQNLGFGVTLCPVNPQDFTCNDVWGNEWNGPANYDGCDMTGMNGNISADPLFCAPQARDFSLDANSPCSGGLNPCGLVGALDVGCGVASIEESPRGPSASLRLLSPQPVASGSDIRIALELPDGSTGRLAVYGATGRCIAVLNQGALGRGRHEFIWRTTSQRLPSGVYYVVLTGIGLRLSTAVVLL
jgi:hypothetical protein